jgi:hypothetical protein
VLSLCIVPARQIATVPEFYDALNKFIRDEPVLLDKSFEFLLKMVCRVPKLDVCQLLWRWADLSSGNIASFKTILNAKQVIKHFLYLVIATVRSFMPA